MQVDKQLITKLITAITKINQETQSGWFMEGWDVNRPDDFKKVIEFANKLNNVSSFDEIEVIVKACLNQIIGANNNQYKEVLQDFKVNRPIYARDAARDKYGSSFNVNAKISDKEVNDYIAEEANEVKIIYTNSENIIKSIFNGLNATINNEKKEYSFESSKNVKANNSPQLIKKKASEIRRGDKIRSGFIYIAKGPLERITVNGKPRYEIPCENGLGLEVNSPSDLLEIVK